MKTCNLSHLACYGVSENWENEKQILSNELKGKRYKVKSK